MVNLVVYSSSNIIRVIKSGRMRRAGRVARMGERRGDYMVSVGRSNEKNHLEVQGVGGDNIKLY